MNYTKSGIVAVGAPNSDARLRKEIEHHLSKVNEGKWNWPITAHFTDDQIQRAKKLGIIK